jgi:hypothetical protein
MPTHSSSIDIKAYAALRSPSRRNKYSIKTAVQTRSLLAAGFNNFWCTAINEQYDYFAMLHADVAPQDGWLDVLVDEIERTQADLISVVIPIKDHYGLTSTAIGDIGSTWRPRRRLTMREVHDLPETFDAKTAGYPDGVLLINTGCFIADLSKPWCRATKADGTAEFFFTINDRITCRDGLFETEVESEDWFASRTLHRLGAKVLATRKVALSHRGNGEYTNTAPWGTLAKDYLASKRVEMVKRGCPYKTADGKEVIHVHIPKNAGTSLWQVVGKPPEVGYRITHATVDKWRQCLGDERYDKAISFAVIRNPYDRMYSAWSYFTGPHPTSPTWPGLAANGEWVKGNSGPDCTFEYFVMNSDKLENQWHFSPQWKWLCRQHDGKKVTEPDVSFQLRFENLDQEWQEFCALIGLNVDPLPHRNASTHGRWEDAYTPEMIERANELYARDFDALPYQMLSPDQFAGIPALTA